MRLCFEFGSHWLVCGCNQSDLWTTSATAATTNHATQKWDTSAEQAGATREIGISCFAAVLGPSGARRGLNS